MSSHSSLLDVLLHSQLPHHLPLPLQCSSVCPVERPSSTYDRQLPFHLICHIFMALPLYFPSLLQCSSVCPVGAIIEHSEWRQVLDALENKTKVGSAVKWCICCICCGGSNSCACIKHSRWRQVLDALEKKTKVSEDCSLHEYCKMEPRTTVPRLVESCFRALYGLHSVWAATKCAPLLVTSSPISLPALSQVMVIQTAPSVRVSIGEELGLAPGRQVTAVFNGCLARCLRFPGVKSTKRQLGLAPGRQAVSACSFCNSLPCSPTSFVCMLPWLPYSTLLFLHIVVALTLALSCLPQRVHGADGGCAARPGL